MHFAAISDFGYFPSVSFNFQNSLASVQFLKLLSFYRPRVPQSCDVRGADKPKVQVHEDTWARSEKS